MYLLVVLKSPSQLFYKNGQPFPAHRPVGLRVNITHIELALEVPVTQEVLQEPESNVVKVAFTVRKAGRYEVAVKLGGLNVAYSPYYKIFQPGKLQVQIPNSYFSNTPCVWNEGPYIQGFIVNVRISIHHL